MKTTFKLPDRLFREAKMTAAARSQSMRQFFTDAISEKLKSLEKEKKQKPWMKHYGALKRHRKELQRIDRIIEKEFESVNLDD